MKITQILPTMFEKNVSSLTVCLLEIASSSTSSSISFLVSFSFFFSIYVEDSRFLGVFFLCLGQKPRALKAY